MHQVEGRIAKPYVTSSPALGMAAGRLNNVPAIRTDAFTGRTQILLDLERNLINHQIVAMSGLGGVGKTQTALEYVRQYAGKYTALLWINASSATTSMRSYREIALLLKPALPEEMADPEVVDFVNHWLSTNADWLLIFDNADTPQHIKGFLPQKSKGHILLTSRADNFQQIGRRVQAVSIKVMLPGDALAFFIVRTGGETSSEPERQAASELARELGYFPLAMEQAAAFMVEHAIPFADYLERYKSLRAEQRLALLEREKPMWGEYPETVRTTWELSFQSLEQAHPLSARLLLLSAFLHPDAIQIELIQTYLQFAVLLDQMIVSVSTTTNMDVLDTSECLTPLRRYSLVEWQPNTRAYSLHRLVQMVIQSRLGENARKDWILRAIKILFELRPDKLTVETWSSYEALLPHIDTTYKNAADANIQTLELAACANAMSMYQKMRGNFQQAKEWVARALTLFSSVEGEFSSHAIASRSMLSGVLNDLKQSQDAKQQGLETLKLIEKHLSNDMRTRALCLNNLGNSVFQMEQYHEAAVYFEEARALYADPHAFDQLEWATACNNLSACYDYMSQKEKALAEIDCAIKVRRLLMSSNEPLLAQAINNKAVNLHKQERPLEAYPLYLEALEIFDKSSLAPDHPWFKDCQRNFDTLRKQLHL